MATDVYIPIDYFRKVDQDHSSARIRDMPHGKPRESLAIYPAEIIFPTTEVGHASPPYPVIITNNGYDVLVISGMKIVGDFIFSGNIQSINPGEQASIMISFTPQRDGAVTGGLYINTGDAAGAEFLPFSGSGINDLNILPTWSSGVGTPEGYLVAPPGSIYTNTEGGTGKTFYVKETGSGNTGWIAK
jgi:hypothetical protein